MAVVWADVSEWQSPVNDTYPHPVLAIRSNDGGYRDKKWNTNYEWARHTLDAGRLSFLIVYLVYRPDWEQTAQTHIDMVGSPHPRMVTMIDVESWGGEITGDHSDGINRLYWRLADWLGSPKRVIGYGNRGDLDSLWPTKPPGIRLVVASYSSVPKYPGMIAHQYSDCEVTVPFGSCDANSANDYDDPDALAADLGIGVSSFTHLGRERPMLHMEPTTTQTGTPDATWTPREETITMVGPVGGWAGRQLVHFTPGNGGAWIQEAWFGPSGTHMVSPDKPALVKQFDTQGWEAPSGSRVFVIRYASCSRGSITVETEH